MAAVVYLLESTDNYTYVGATVNLDRRIRQHNKEIKGGAHITSNKVINGEYWNIVCYVSGFPDWKSALQFEWRWKQLSRKISLKIKPVIKRMEALKQLLQLDRATSKAIPYCEWKEKPFVNFIENPSQELVSLFNGGTDNATNI
jgi:structure-specific endonuclease subunit SLX1